ncbi:hypothetical protein F4553_002050 [Allocatelliglobosispora scoriae]|uniref:Uncharacterized protein n=1 Tax=Allocatelliglobosispora scoriae TaxID=643052 RepID=A0A841BPB7_9ACTN|nr:hypothetical protein [Allocatelliglobosispora scoriae]MBB5868671.1 hypothetical protein [Allocatelliglobosispora scoriae]
MAELETIPRAELDTLQRDTLHLASSPTADVLTEGYRSMVEIRAAYRRALHARDEAAAHLVAHEAWSLGDIAHVLCGHRHHTERAAVILAWTQPPDRLPGAQRRLHDAQRTALRLRGLLTLLTGIVEERLAEPPQQSEPDADPVQRLFDAEQQMQRVRTFRDTTEATRDVIGATLVTHHGWRLRQVAAIAEAETTDISAAYAVARLSSPSDADTGALREVSILARHLGAEADRLTAIREAAAAECQAAGLPGLLP